MILQPKRTKYKKLHKGRNKGYSNDNKVNFGDFGIKAITRGSITSRQIESARKVITRFVKNNGKMWIRIFPDKPITKKPLEVRMGKGKGNVEYWVAVVKPGKILYEISGVNINDAKKIFKLASAKLCVKTVFVCKEESLWKY